VTILRSRDLQQMLLRHRPHDAEEARHVELLLSLCDAPQDPFSRSHFEPGHFTASAFVLSPDERALLLIFHGKLHRWLQPGGHVEDGDTDILAAARREVLEEVGLCDLPLAAPGIFDVDVHAIPALKGDPAHAHYDVRFAFRARELGFRAASDAEAARWVPLDEVDEGSSDRSVMRAVEKLRAR
jgi:8-oxo-dGTP pyrophosphatase MutT (NUDIX family)